MMKLSIDEKDLIEFIRKTYSNLSKDEIDIIKFIRGEKMNPIKVLEYIQSNAKKEQTLKLDNSISDWYDFSKEVNKPCIYLIKNMVTNKKYIGKTINELSKRIKIHLKELALIEHGNHNLQADFNNFGFQSFKVFILEYPNEDEIEFREKFYVISVPIDESYNIQRGPSHIYEFCQFCKENHFLNFRNELFYCENCNTEYRLAHPLNKTYF